MQSHSETSGSRIPAHGTINPHGRIFATWVLDHLYPIASGFVDACLIKLWSYISGTTPEGLCRLVLLCGALAAWLGPPVVRFGTFQTSDERCVTELGVGLAKVVGFLLPSAASQAVGVLLWQRGAFVSCGVVASFLVLDYHAPKIDRRLRVLVITRSVAYCGFRLLSMHCDLMRAANRRYEAWEDQRGETSAAAFPPLVYRPLDAKRREIRVLQLYRRTWRAELACSFITISVDDVERLCPFEAISYTWRGEARTAHILVDDRRVSVTPTVARFLRYRRSFFSQAFLWVDAVCINQDDTAERGSQVLLMGDIYRRAERTRVSLAHPTEARNASDARGVLASVLSVSSLSDSVPEEQRLAILQHIVQTDRQLPALAALFARSYFHRIWLVQEVTLAKEVLVMYGDIVMEWAALGRVAEMLSHPSLAGMIHGYRDDRNRTTAANTLVVTDDGTHMSNITRINAMREECWQGAIYDTLFPRFKLPTTLHDALTERELYCFHATDPRDKILGVLGLVSDRPGSLVGSEGSPYEKPASDLYIRTARYLIAQTKSLSILQFAGSWRPGVGSPRFGSLPSWVPDWHHIVGRRIKPGPPPTSGGNRRGGGGVPHTLGTDESPT